MQCKDVGSDSTCLRNALSMSTLTWKVSQILYGNNINGGDKVLLSFPSPGIHVLEKGAPPHLLAAILSRKPGYKKH